MQSRIASCVLLILASFLVQSVALSASDTCTTQGGTANCVGPEVGPFIYLVGNGAGINTQGSDEASAIAAFEAIDRQNTCTYSLTDAAPAWVQQAPIGHGNAASGDYSAALFNAVGQYWNMGWTLSTERQQERIPLKSEKTFYPNGSSPCNSSQTRGVKVHRARTVVCPENYDPNTATPPTNAYCYRPANQRDTAKDLGPRCPLCGHPVSPGSGNKFLAETDYKSPSASPLEFVRYYNSFSNKAHPNAATRPNLMLGPNWRSTYERTVRFTASSVIPTLYAYRHDGQTFHFTQVSGVFVGDPDVADRVEQLTDSLGTITGWKYTIDATDEIESYDAAGKLLSIQSRNGIVQTLTHDADGLVTSVTDSFGATLTFAHDANNRLVSFTDPSGNQVVYDYNAFGNISTVTYPGIGFKTYLYNESSNTGGRNRPHLLTGVLDESGTRFANYLYDQYDRATVSELANALSKYTFNYGGTVVPINVTITDPLLQQRTYTFATLHGVGRNTGISQPCVGCGNSKTITYDASSNVTSRTDYRNNKTCYAYDTPRNLEIARLEGVASGSACPANIANHVPPIGSSQRKTLTQWHSTYRLPTQIDETGRRTSFTYDASGNALTKTILDTSTSEARTWTYTYNAFGQPLTADGPRSDVADVTTYTYHGCSAGNHCGQVHTVTNALGHVTTYSVYNGSGQPLTITDPNGVVTTLVYDDRGRLTSRTIGTEQTTFEYWSTGLLKKTALPDGSYLEYTYDAAHRLTDINDDEGNRIHYTLDAMGNRTKEELFDPSNALTTTRTQVFNALSRLSQQIGAAGGANVTTTFGYDNDGNQTSIQAPLSRNTAQTYDTLSRLRTVTDPASGLTTYGYDALDQLISVIDPKGLTTSYLYNALGDLKQQVSPDTGTTTNTYDTAGNLETSIDARSKTAAYDYDALNRVASVTYADQVIGYTYDTGTNQKGRLTQITDNSGSTSWSYDTQGRVLSRQQTMGSVSKSVGYGYDASGRVQSITLPSGNVVTYGYANGKVVSLTLNGSTTLLSNVLYHPFGPITGWAWGNSTLAVRDYDQDGKVSLVDSAGLSTYAYDDAFRITSITDASDPNLSQSYGYDLLDRLTSATATSLNQSWTYDANGNRLTQGGSQASTYTVSGTSNRVNSIAGALTQSYGYDTAGNTTSDGAATYTYNDAGRMISATKAGVTTTYSLNALGQRVRKTTSGSSTYFVYDEAGHLISEYDNVGSLIAETIWFADIPVAVLKPNGSGGVNVFYIHTDHLNTPRRISRPSDNAIVWRWDSDPFGSTSADENPSGIGAFAYGGRFPGQYFDSETGLHYNYFRDYDPAVGRYIESDPIGLKGGINTYAYVGGNPLSAVDPLGLHCRCVAQIPTKQYTGRGGGEGYRNWAGRRAVGITCAYTCTRSDGSSATVTGSHQVSFWFEDGYELACIGVEYTQKVRPDGTHIWMDPVAMPFDPASSASPELRNWAQSNCKCK